MSFSVSLFEPTFAERWEDFFSHYASSAIWGRVFTNIRSRHSDLLSSMGILVLNTCVVASRAFRSIPALVGNGAQVWLSAMGVISLNYYFKLIGKSIKDLRFALVDRQWEGMVLSAFKTTVKVVDMLLCCGTFAASIFALVNMPIYATVLYRLMRPVGLASVLAGIGFEFNNYYFESRIIKQLSSVDGRFQQLFDCLKKTLLKEKTIANYSWEDKKLVLRILRHSESFNVEEMEKKLKEFMNASKQNQDAFSKELFDVIVKNFRQKQLFTKTNLNLIGFGYVCMGISKAYPQTLLEAIVLWVVSSLWTGKTAFEKYDQEATNKSLSELNVCGR